MQIFLTGGTGLVGTKLVPRLIEAGHQVLLLTRDAKKVPPRSGLEVVEGDPTQTGPWLHRLAECDAVIHLAGEPVFGRRWSRRFKERIRESRVVSTQLVSQELAQHPLRKDGSPKIFLCASAIGFYGMRLNDEESDETSPPGKDFLAEVSVEWEKACQPARDAKCRVVNIRVGVVLDASGGALPKMVRPFKWFLGGVLASGKQWISWIHYQDMVGLIEFALNNSHVEGPINATSPEPIKNWGFSKTLGKVLSRPCWFPTPGFILRIVVGPGAEIVTQGQRVLPRKAEQLGYHFHFTDLEAALRDVLNRK